MGMIIGVGNTKPTFPYDYYYGIEWDKTVSNPKPSRIGKAELHKSLPLQSMMRRCILKDSGEVNYYLNANDSTKRDNGAVADLTGGHGDRKSTRLNSSHANISYAVFCLKKKSLYIFI